MLWNVFLFPSRHNAARLQYGDCRFKLVEFMGKAMLRIIIVTDIFDLPQLCNGLLDGGGKAGHECSFLRLADLSGHPGLRGDALHKHLFVDGGFQMAVKSLCEMQADNLIGLGFSAGGTALWRAASQGLNLRALVCVSSTRLRYETSPLAIPTYVFWGGKDKNRPSEAWNRSVPTGAKTYHLEDHGFYQDQNAPSAQTLHFDILKALKMNDLLKTV